MRVDFQECQACAANPGKPVLCASCVHNRAVISSARYALEQHAAAPGRAGKVGMLMVGIVVGTMPWVSVLWWLKWLEWLRWLEGKL